VALGASSTIAAAELAWSRPIGLELYSLRGIFPKDPAGILERVAQIGFKEIEFTPTLDAKTMQTLLRDSGLTAPSAYLPAPSGIEAWKRTVADMTAYGFEYLVIGDNPVLDAEGWIRRADVLSEFGKIVRDAGMKFCYHAHYNEFARLGSTTGYEILLERCDPKLLNMEMDIFWATYAGADPLSYWRRFPGRFPLLHVKDIYANIPVNPRQSPPVNGPNPFAPVGQGNINWPRLFAHAPEAGVKHIFVEQDRFNRPPFEALQTSFDYLKNLRLK
jgi:sugar phosphate isomerase/epimerase